MRLDVILWFIRAMVATVDFWGLERLWMGSTGAARLMITVTLLLIACSTLSTLFLTFGSAIEGNRCVVSCS